MNKFYSCVVFVVSFLCVCSGYSNDSETKFDPKRESLSASQVIPCWTAPNGVIDIQKVMDYPIPHVIARFCKTYQVSEEDARVYERELKRYFILAVAYPDDHLSMLSSDVDNLWHTFILFTKDYQKFCNEIFGRFFHHIPEIDINDVQESS